MVWTVKLFVCCLALKLSSGEENVQLEIAQGKLNGLKNITVYHGMPFYSFRGIPYAKPNVGRNRFNVAVPLESWSGVLDATRHGTPCVHLNTGQKIQGDEDCLFLNVYTPDLDKAARRAVMVFIHGGGFFSGSGDDWLYGPDFLLEKDIVLVTLNYRLGVIGFLNTGDASAPGNVGLKDQNLALRWVQNNIINFGGAPERVTIFGQSAGAASVHYHMMSPMSHGLFKGAILHSGAAINPWDFTDTPRDDALMLGSILGIDITNTMTLVEELKDRSVEDVLMASKKIESMEKGPIFVPSVEAYVGQDIFLAENPWKMITTGEISDVPVMIGITDNEYGYWGQSLISLFSKYERPLDELIPIDLYRLERGKIDPITNILGKYYSNGLSIIKNPSALNRLHNDAFTNHGPLISAAIMNARMSSPVYKYLFKYYTSQGLFKALFPPVSEVVSYDDLVFIFYSPILNNRPESGTLDEQKTDEMVEMWTNFAKEGNPSAIMESTNVVWDPMDENNKYLDIGMNLKMKTHLWRNRVKLWARFYEKFIGDYMKLFD